MPCISTSWLPQKERKQMTNSAKSLNDIIAEQLCKASERIFGEPSGSGDWIPNPYAKHVAGHISEAIKKMQSIGVTKEPAAKSVNSEQQGSVSAQAPTERNHAPSDITSEILVVDTQEFQN